MKYFIQEVINDKGLQKTAGIKARDDIDRILLAEGYRPVRIEMDQNARNAASLPKRLGIHFEIRQKWAAGLKDLTAGDILLVQFPVSSHSVLIAGEVMACQRRGVRIILLIHDLDLFRHALRSDVSLPARIRIRLEEKSLLEKADYIIAHNIYMKKKLVSFGLDSRKILNLGIFDYLIPGFEDRIGSRKPLGRDLPVIIAGSMMRHKAGYVYDLPEDQAFNLYGIGYEDENRPGVVYHGAFPPDDLPFEVEGSFGLVWDGDTRSTCSGTYGEYLRINNPHKTSMYLASGIPVIIWEEAALADFVRRHHCGITVASLDEIGKTLREMPEEEYRLLVKNAGRMSERLRSGSYTRRALGIAQK